MSAAARVVIKPVADASAAIALGRAAGLEDAEGDTEGLLVRWGAYEGDRLVGTVALRHWSGMYVVGWMAVAEDRRGTGVGAGLLQALEDEAVARGADHLWVTARAPGFYYRAGFAPLDDGRRRELLLGPCVDCEQFGVSCHPVAAVKPLPGRVAATGGRSGGAAANGGLSGGAAVNGSRSGGAAAAGPAPDTAADRPAADDTSPDDATS